MADNTLYIGNEDEVRDVIHNGSTLIIEGDLYLGDDTIPYGSYYESKTVLYKDDLKPYSGGVQYADICWLPVEQAGAYIVSYVIVFKTPQDAYAYDSAVVSRLKYNGADEPLTRTYLRGKKSLCVKLNGYSIITCPENDIIKLDVGLLNSKPTTYTGTDTYRVDEVILNAAYIGPSLENR